MSNKKQLARIDEYEQILSSSINIISNISKALSEYQHIQPSINKLAKYYGSKEWFDDLKDYDNNKLPKDINAGILSEDGIYNMLLDNEEIALDMQEISKEILKKKGDNMRELVIKKCLKCGATVKVIEDCNCKDCGISCCGEPMKVLMANSSDGAAEKHLPEYNVKDNKLFVNVDHVMDEDHYIEWICLVADDREEYFYLNPGDETTVTFKKTKPAILYSYCNKHGLWKTEIK